ncbi:uncharacterized protein LOC127879423 [Dreissena polymorpha]|uniref:uncharacterized protein LOC127879422 n=1 Tax=Dreissena polymorpha TaxID=45954 RepID=UPI002265494A|nr:uncharacterized protein LOC127879422 [Dreissena polymorpha]XP_052282200.1 uncharacterized protein LOC127879423 [Dreissena polymorpha]
MLRNENCLLVESVESVKNLKRDNELANMQLRTEIKKKRLAQKSNSSLRKKIKKLKTSDEKVTAIQLVKQNADLRQKLERLTLIAEENDLLIEDFHHKLKETKDYTDVISKSNNTYSEYFRMCVIQLAGLEVATDKISPVISVVSETIFDKCFAKGALPNSTSVQRIVDEGQFIAKSFLAEKLENSQSWGLGRDGTTRRKQKIVDTSITLDNGEIASLGFTRIANETAQTIQNVTKEQLSELGSLNGNSSEDFIVSSLAKLAFTMSDRASNEKLADKLLNKWRDDLLKNCSSETEVKSVKNFHCMAHVLLGFHRYVCTDIKLLEKELSEVGGPLGRDSLPAFKFWSKGGTVIERVVRTTADTFGPAGEHYGLRDRWEAYCRDNGIKSTIGNYRDNRFNCLFQTAAEILVHRQEFLTVIKTVKKPNRKIQAVSADLHCTRIATLLAATGLMYVHVTGPFGN